MNWPRVVLGLIGDSTLAFTGLVDRLSHSTIYEQTSSLPVNLILGNHLAKVLLLLESIDNPPRLSYPEYWPNFSNFNTDDSQRTPTDASETVPRCFPSVRLARTSLASE